MRQPGVQQSGRGQRGWEAAAAVRGVQGCGLLLPGVPGGALEGGGAQGGVQGKEGVAGARERTFDDALCRVLLGAGWTGSIPVAILRRGRSS